MIFFTIQVNFTRLIFTLFFTVNLFFTRLFSWFLHNSLFSYMTFTQFISFRTWYLHYSFIFYTTNSFRLSFRFTINFHMMFLHDNTFHVFFFFTWLIKLNSFDTVLIYFCIHFQREACGFIFHIHDSFLSVLFKWCYLSSRCFSSTWSLWLRLKNHMWKKYHRDFSVKVSSIEIVRLLFVKLRQV